MMFAAHCIGARYREYATHCRVVAEAGVRTAGEFDLDYVSCFSDATREEVDCGAAVQYCEPASGNRRNTPWILEGMGKLGCEIVELDFMVPLAEGREKMGGGQVLPGNIDPVLALRDGLPESVTAAMAECQRHAASRYAVGAGCEVPRDTLAEKVRAGYARVHPPEA